MLYLPKHRMPAESFIRQYMEYCDRLETAREYDFWGAVWALSTAVGREVVIARPNAPVYFNWYIILAADSGVTRKSTAVNLAQKVLLLSSCADDALMVEGQTSTGQFLKKLNAHNEEHGKCNTVISVSELVRFLPKGASAQGIPGVLTDLYDCPKRQKFFGTMTAEMTELTNVFVSMMTASTPAWLVRSINPNVIEGGFTSRTMFIIGQRRKQTVAWGSDDTPEIPRQLATLLRDTVQRTLEHTNGVGITINERALGRFRSWYSKLRQPNDSFRVSFFSRQDAHVLRLAGILCINDLSFIIQKRHIDAAISIIHNVRETAAELFDTSKVSGDVIHGIRKVQEDLIDAGISGVSTAPLFAQVRHKLSNQQFHAVLSLMHEMGLVQRFEIRKGAGRAVTVWRGTDLLLQPAAIDELVKRLD